MDPSRLPELYRRDRRKLLEFILSSASTQSPSGPATAATAVDFSAVDLDTISVDYVIDRIRSGGVLDLSEASKWFLDEVDFPIVTNAPFRRSFFLLSNSDKSGSPPRRYAPETQADIGTHSLNLAAHSISSEAGQSKNGTFASCQTGKDTDMFSLGLPPLHTGLSDDDFRESAYEVLLACLILSGVRVCSSEERKKSRSFRGLRSKRDGSNPRSQLEETYADLLDTIRVQMELKTTPPRNLPCLQKPHWLLDTGEYLPESFAGIAKNFVISEAVDRCIKQGLRCLGSRMMNEKINVPQISLELLTTISKLDFPNEKSYLLWLKRQVNILEEFLHDSGGCVADGQNLVLLLSKLKNLKECYANNGSNGHTEILTTLRRFASGLSDIPGKFGIPSESLYWTKSYHVNLRVYEKLLSSVFDVLEDWQIVKDAEEMLKVLKLTWPMLGITKKMHDALYAWVLFQQFTRTGEMMLLKFAILEIQKVLSSDNDGVNVKAYTNSLICTTRAYGRKRDLSLVDAVLFNVKLWCHSQLEDYHLHFNKDKAITFERMLSLAILLEEYFADNCREIKCSEFRDGDETAPKLLHSFLEKSIRTAYKRVLDYLDVNSKLEQKQPLAMLANELKSIAEKESTVFTPVLYPHYPEAKIHSSVLLHQLYGEQLKPFLKSVTDLSESVISVLAAADSLERALTKTLGSTIEVVAKSLCTGYLQSYKIKDVCAPLILYWINGRHDNILEWTKRAIHIEDWEPLSPQQRQATSIVEVFRIIEETIDQFFKLDIPMDVVHLRSLLIGIVRSLEAYLLHIVNEQVDKKTLYPTPPALTRFEDSIYPLLKKKTADQFVLGDNVLVQLNHLQASKLCVKLNTLHYIRDQLDALEESIEGSWMLFCSVNGQSEEPSISTESVDELFTVFDDVKRSAVSVSDDIMNFIGARVIFWELRDPLLSTLYKGSVGTTRLEMFLPQLDEVLNNLCCLILDKLRDQVVLSICRASMDGYAWVMLDGGPWRAFSETDVEMMQEDLNSLKELFVADGEGLQRAVVEEEARYAQQILDLYKLKADSIIEMLTTVSAQASDPPYHKKPRTRSAGDAYVLLRVLCHKKDKDASNYLKLHYQLPRSSDYNDENTSREWTSKSPLLTDMLRRNTSIDWTERGQRSFRMIKKKLHEATSEIKYAPW